ncbi:hypothetical protein [Aquimarina aggregata]|uniref:hypothetical protein n=1 Tax=Aquimarina aggregata TaxID=1642818 RepID=UPI00248FE6C7|nr:hypothetical protein [Aquimarina aggregata]
MSLILITIGYYLDYKHNPKQFISDLKGGLSFLSILIFFFLFVLYILGSGVLYAIFGIAIVLPMTLILRQYFKKKSSLL